MHFQPTKNYLPVTFVTMPININYYVPIVEMQRFFIFILIFHVFIINFRVLVNSMTCFTSDIFFAINNIFISVNKSNFTFVFFKAVCHTNPGAVRKRAGSSSYISRYTIPKFSNTSTIAIIFA